MTTYTLEVGDKTGKYFLFKGAEGAKANYQLLHEMDVHAITSPMGEGAESGETIIPFHAVAIAMITATVTEDPEVTDAVCNETNA